MEQQLAELAANLKVTNSIFAETYYYLTIPLMMT